MRKQVIITEGDNGWLVEYTNNDHSKKTMAYEHLSEVVSGIMNFFKCGTD
jgi:hypothetical protein